jgi:hypothetical protein
VLGEEGRGVRVLMSGLDYERVVLSGGPIGIMQACMDVVMPYVHERKQFGKAIGEFQLMQGKLADMYTTLNACRAYVYAVARPATAARNHAQGCAAVILYARRRKPRMVALEAIQALGGNGYINEYPTGRLLRDAKLYEIGAGTSEIRRMLIGRELFRRRPDGPWNLPDDHDTRRQRSGPESLQRNRRSHARAQGPALTIVRDEPAGGGERLAQRHERAARCCRGSGSRAARPGQPFLEIGATAAHGVYDGDTRRGRRSPVSAGSAAAR